MHNKARIHWACRRGMRELDISIMPFFEHEYDSLSDEEKRIFVRLLQSDDPDLFNWLMNHGKPADAELEQISDSFRHGIGNVFRGNLIYASHGALSGSHCSFMGWFLR
ncbi:FAD assembly factor SdhE [Salmonella enterica subsp. enterica serovar Infantis]|nr:FAD assembly factor SdhE [Salmonella enterica subsp. enterica serovar Infantis]